MTHHQVSAPRWAGVAARPNQCFAVAARRTAPTPTVGTRPTHVPREAATSCRRGPLTRQFLTSGGPGRRNRLSGDQHQLPCGREQSQSGSAQDDAICTTSEQRHPDVSLEPTHGGTHCLLGQEQASSCRREALLLGRCDEVAEVPQIHDRCGALWARRQARPVAGPPLCSCRVRARGGRTVEQPVNRDTPTVDRHNGAVEMARVIRRPEVQVRASVPAERCSGPPSPS